MIFAVKNLCLEVEVDSLEKKVLLHSINFDIDKEGQITIILGDNGAGKSTLLKTIAGYYPKATGELFLKEEFLSSDRQKRAARISYVPQDPRQGTVDHLTLAENLAFAMKRGQVRDLLFYTNVQRQKYFKELLSELDMGLEDRLDDPVSSLSGGQRQALSLIMGTSSPADLLLLDEITASLDPLISNKLIGYIKKIVHQKKISVIMISHDLEEALALADRIIVLRKGKVHRVLIDEELESLSTTDLLKSVYHVS